MWLKDLWLWASYESPLLLGFTRGSTVTMEVPVCMTNRRWGPSLHPASPLLNLLSLSRGPEFSQGFPSLSGLSPHLPGSTESPAPPLRFTASSIPALSHPGLSHLRALPRLFTWLTPACPAHSAPGYHLVETSRSCVASPSDLPAGYAHTHPCHSPGFCLFHTCSCYYLLGSLRLGTVPTHPSIPSSQGSTRILDWDLFGWGNLLRLRVVPCLGQSSKPAWLQIFEIKLLDQRCNGWAPHEQGKSFQQIPVRPPTWRLSLLECLGAEFGEPTLHQASLLTHMLLSASVASSVRWESALKPGVMWHCLTLQKCRKSLFCSCVEAVTGKEKRLQTS